MLGNPTWIWAHWLYRAQESSWCRVRFTPYFDVCRILTSSLLTYLVFLSVKYKEDFTAGIEHQPLHSEMGTPIGNIQFDIKKLLNEHLQHK